MNSRSAIALCLAYPCALGACGRDLDPVAVAIEIPVGDELRLPLSEERHYVDDLAETWDLVQEPEGSHGTISSTGVDQYIFSTDTRGEYIVDRRTATGVSERWTHRFYIYATNRAPEAIIEGENRGRVGVAHVLDASASNDSETLSLEYSWRLTFRPEDSDATLSDTSSPTVTLLPDKPGRYEVEVGVFDGEVWSAEDSLLRINVFAE